jgi:hypothetical protein
MGYTLTIMDMRGWPMLLISQSYQAATFSRTY